MKLLVCDVEGTIFKAEYKIDGTDFPSTMWQPLAHSLGPEAIREERESHKKWESKGYSNYTAWVEATFEIHKKHNLHIGTFNKLINDAEYMAGVVDFFEKIDRSEYIPVLVSGGFEELILRAQDELKIKYGAGACKYFFDKENGRLKDCSLKPCDFDGKYDYVQTIFKTYNLDPSTDWVFIGDGKNDVDIAQRAPLSFGINAHSKLAGKVTHNVRNFNEIYDLLAKNQHIIHLGQDAILEDDLENPQQVYDEKYRALIRDRDTALSQLDLKETQTNILHAQIEEIESLYKAEVSKRQMAEETINNFGKKLEALDCERILQESKSIELQRELQNTTESARAEIEKRIEELNIESAKNQTAMLEVSKKISNLSNEVADLENYIAENEDRISALKTRNQQLEEEREQFESDSRLTKKNIESAHKAQKRLCANLFKNIDYSDNSITVLSSNKIPKKLRRILDLLNDGERNIPGIESCPWHSQKDMWEYKFSDAGRVFVVFVPPAKPLITDIDFNHKH